MNIRVNLSMQEVRLSCGTGSLSRLSAGFIRRGMRQGKPVGRFSLGGGKT